MSRTPEAQDQYVYQVHPSYKSQTAIRITRKIIPLSLTGAPKIQQENPYVFKPKSYSKKRNFRESISPSHLPPPPTKKYKFNSPNKQIYNTQNLLDKTYLLTHLTDFSQNFFKESCLENTNISNQQSFKLPINLSTLNQNKQNPLLSHKIEIVSTQNKKLAISIHQGLLKSNTNHSKQQQSLQGIVNPFNSQLKKYFSDKIDFIRDYKSGYTPIQLQNRSKKEEDKQGGYEQTKKDRSNQKTHFIKKKQSTLSLPRTCGVSYIKPSESTQNQPYDPLPPLIFQCSTSCTYTPSLRQIFHSEIERFIKLSESKWMPVIMSNEEHMRDILLGKPFGKVLWVEGLLNLWPLFNQGNFMLVFFHKQLPQTEQEVWKQFNTCYFKFGILAKKSTSGKKLFLKSIQIESNDKDQTLSLNSFPSVSETYIKIENPNQNGTKMENENNLVSQMDIQRPDQRPIEQKKLEQTPPEQKKQCKDVCEEFMKELKSSRTVITMSLKFEMYIDQLLWKGSTNQTKNLLNAIIHSYQQHLQKKAIEVIRDRLQLSNKYQRQILFSQLIKKIKIGHDISHLPPAEKYAHSPQNSITLQTLNSLNNSLQQRNSLIPSKSLLPINEIYKDKEGKQNIGLWQKSLKMPIYYISTRDSFAFDLVENITYHQRDGRTFKRIQYHFEPDNLPDNFYQYKRLFPQLNVGATCYHDFFSQEQLQMFEAQTLQTQVSAFKNKFLQMTVQPTIIGSRIKRTKFFFGYRYMWTRCQLAEPNSYVGAGVRRDVTPAPQWVKQIQNPMIEHGILQPNFINSVAINVYHDGTQGLAQHFDDAVRFRQPIYTVRLVSDGRLSFGSQFYGFCNGAFIIPLPRGCICVLNENSYAANGVKHCVRPCDMSGKSAAVIMRQMHHQVVKEAAKYDQLIDFPSWLSTLSSDSRAITFAQQKRRQAEQIIGDEDRKKEKEVPKAVELK